MDGHLVLQFGTLHVSGLLGILCVGVPPADKVRDGALFLLNDSFLVFKGDIGLDLVGVFIEALWLHADAVVEVRGQAQVSHERQRCFRVLALGFGTPTEVGEDMLRNQSRSLLWLPWVDCSHNNVTLIN